MTFLEKLTMPFPVLSTKEEMDEVFAKYNYVALFVAKEDDITTNNFKDGSIEYEIYRFYRSENFDCINTHYNPTERDLTGAILVKTPLEDEKFQVQFPVFHTKQPKPISVSRIVSFLGKHLMKDMYPLNQETQDMILKEQSVHACIYFRKENDPTQTKYDKRFLQMAKDNKVKLSSFF